MATVADKKGTETRYEGIWWGGTCISLYICYLSMDYIIEPRLCDTWSLESTRERSKSSSHILQGNLNLFFDWQFKQKIPFATILKARETAWVQSYTDLGRQALIWGGWVQLLYNYAGGVDSNLQQQLERYSLCSFYRSTNQSPPLLLSSS